MFGLIYAVFFLLYMLARVTFMVIKVVFYAVAFAIRAGNRRHARKVHARKVRKYPTINGIHVFK
jgi:uncharacterized membrane protein